MSSLQLLHKMYELNISYHLLLLVNQPKLKIHLYLGPSFYKLRHTLKVLRGAKFRDITF